MSFLNDNSGYTIRSSPSWFKLYLYDVFYENSVMTFDMIPL